MAKAAKTEKEPRTYSRFRARLQGFDAYQGPLRNNRAHAQRDGLAEALRLGLVGIEEVRVRQQRSVAFVEITEEKDYLKEQKIP